MTCHRAASRAAALSLLFAGAAWAQSFPTAPSAGIPLVVDSSALDDEATALSSSPGGLAFARALEFEYVRAQSFSAVGQSGDGLFVSAGAGPLVLGISTEWMGSLPCAAPALFCNDSRTHRMGYGAALRLGNLGVGVVRHTWSATPGTSYDGFAAWDLGLTFRPLRALSFAFSVLGVDTPRLGLTDLNPRFVLGVGVRPLGERVTLGADAIASKCDQGEAATFPPSRFSRCGAGLGVRFTGDVLVSKTVHVLGQVFRDTTFDRWSGQVGVSFDLGHLGVAYSQAVNPLSGSQGSLRVRLSSEAWPSPSMRHAALVKLDETLNPAPRSLWSLVLGGTQRDPHAETLAALHKLAMDDSVAAVVLTSSGMPGGMGKADELRKGIEGLRLAGKYVLFFLESGGDLEYYVATAADRILTAPQAGLTINGFSATALFAAEGLHKLGVKAEFVRVGAYKNAPDTFTRQDMSAEQREVQNALLDDVYGRFVREVAGRRHLEEGKLKGLLDRGILRPQEAVNGGLFDALGYPGELEEEVAKALGKKVPLREVSLPGGNERKVRWGSLPRIALIRVEGTISSGASQGDVLGLMASVGSDSVVKQIRRAADDPRVRAIVVRIDSPGGDGNASDLIWRELQRARKEKHKPVVASMGDVAASGGYYVAVGCDEIFAEPSTITGSIGVFSAKIDASELYEKLGLHFETVKRGQSADLLGTTRPSTDAERKTLQAWVDSFYEQFVARVAEGRKLTPEQVDKVGRGRVWSGQQAQEQGLVDKLGGLEDAIASAAARAGLHAGDELEVDDHGRAEALELSQLAAAAVGPAQLFGAALGGVPRREAVRALRAVSLLGEPGTVRAVLPYVIEVR